MPCAQKAGSGGWSEAAAKCQRAPKEAAHEPFLPALAPTLFLAYDNAGSAAAASTAARCVRRPGCARALSLEPAPAGVPEVTHKATYTNSIEPMLQHAGHAQLNVCVLHAETLASRRCPGAASRSPPTRTASRCTSTRRARLSTACRRCAGSGPTSRPATCCPAAATVPRAASRAAGRSLLSTMSVDNV